MIDYEWIEQDSWNLTQTCFDYGSVRFLATVEVETRISYNSISSDIFEGSSLPIITVWDCEYVQQNIPKD